MELKDDCRFMKKINEGKVTPVCTCTLYENIFTSRLIVGRISSQKSSGL